MRTAIFALLIVLLLAGPAAGHQVADAATITTVGHIGPVLVIALLGVAVGFLLGRMTAGSYAAAGVVLGRTRPVASSKPARLPFIDQPCKRRQRPARRLSWAMGGSLPSLDRRALRAFGIDGDDLFD